MFGSSPVAKRAFHIRHASSDDDSGDPDEDEAIDQTIKEACGLRLTHRVPWEQYAALSVWLLLLVAQYGLTRMVCRLGVPSDCHDKDVLTYVNDFKTLIFMGFMLAVLTGVPWPDRFFYIFRLWCPKPCGLIFLPTFFLAGPAWGGLNFILPSFSLTNGMDPTYIPLVLFLLGGGFALLAWHVWSSFWNNSWRGFLAYVVSRLVILVLVALYFVINAAHFGHVRFHLHHYVVAFVAATLAEFNHPISLLLLAIAAGIFVQGIAAYTADPVLSYEKSRVRFSCDGRHVLSPVVSIEAADFMVHNCTCCLH